MPPYSSLPSGQCRIVPLYRVLENWIYLYATVSTKLIRIAVSAIVVRAQTTKTRGFQMVAATVM